MYDVECHASFSLRGNKNGIGQTLGSMDADVSTEPYIVNISQDPEYNNTLQCQANVQLKGNKNENGSELGDMACKRTSGGDC